MIDDQRARLSYRDASQAPAIAREDLDRLTQFFGILMAWDERETRDVSRATDGEIGCNDGLPSRRRDAADVKPGQ